MKDRIDSKGDLRYWRHSEKIQLAETGKTES